MRIAIAEDETAYSNHLQSHLKRFAQDSGQPMEIECFASGMQLVEHYRGTWDLLLLDVDMPGMNGLEAARMIRQSDPNVLIMFITNLAQYASLMVASHCKWMSRLEIIYTVSANAVRLLNRLGLPDYIPRSCKHYLDEEDHNNVIYRCRGDEAESRLERTAREAAELKQALEDAELTGYEEHELLSRVLREQSDEDADGVRTPKDKGEIRSDSLQNPSDLEATFRRKAGEEHKGYVGNVVETLNDDGLGIITTRLRNGIECRPSLLRRRLDVDNICSPYQVALLG